MAKIEYTLTITYKAVVEHDYQIVPESLLPQELSNTSPSFLHLTDENGDVMANVDLVAEELVAIHDSPSGKHTDIHKWSKKEI